MTPEDKEAVYSFRFFDFALFVQPDDAGYLLF